MMKITHNLLQKSRRIKMSDKEYVYQCVLRTYGLDSTRFEKICGDLRTNEISISFEENCLEGKITICKNNVDSIALESILAKINVRLEDYIYSDKDVSLSECLVKTLSKKGEMMGTAESITGGLISSTLCEVEGASKVFYEGIITYNNGAKVRRLHVPATTLEEYSAVSKQTCEAMLKGLLANKEIVYGVSTTGYASHPNDDLAGLVYIGYGSLSNFNVEEVMFKGDRNTVRKKACNQAMFKLIKLIDSIERTY